jgi:hypothetical protein
MVVCRGGSLIHPLEGFDRLMKKTTMTMMIARLEERKEAEPDEALNEAQQPAQ